MRPVPAGHTTKSDFADNHLRCARSLVSKYVKAGRLVLDDSGRFVHVEQSLARIRATMGAPERALRPDASATAAPAVPPEQQVPFVADSAEKERFYKAETARLDYEQRCGQLMDAGRVVHAVTNAAITLRTALEETAAQIAPRLPIPREAQEQCRLLLAEHIESLLGQLAAAFNQAAIAQ
jgi:hypothetical protein